MLGAHMEAPFLCEKYKGAQLGECLMNPTVEAYEAMTRGTDCVKMMTLAPELPGALDMIAYLRKKGVVTCAAHSDATAEDVHAAADRGLTQITHLFNAQSPLHHRRPGVPGAGLADDRIIVQVIADGLHLHPDVLRIAALCKGAKGMALISDSMEAAGMPDGQYDLGGQAVFVKNGEARLADGVIAGIDAGAAPRDPQHDHAGENAAGNRDSDGDEHPRRIPSARRAMAASSRAPAAC